VLLHLHRPRRSVEAFEVFDDDARIRDIITVADDLIFLDDDDEPIDVNLTLAQVIGGRGRHHHHYDIHRHPCRWINAYISYGDGTQTLQAAPSSRIATVRLRALDLFGIDPDAATNLVLRIPATDVQPSRRQTLPHRLDSGPVLVARAVRRTFERGVGGQLAAVVRERKPAAARSTKLASGK
jgi:hypothetical protein